MWGPLRKHSGEFGPKKMNEKWKRFEGGIAFRHLCSCRVPYVNGKKREKTENKSGRVLQGSQKVKFGRNPSNGVRDNCDINDRRTLDKCWFHELFWYSQARNIVNTDFVNYVSGPGLQHDEWSKVWSKHVPFDGFISGLEPMYKGEVYLRSSWQQNCMDFLDEMI